MVSYKEIVKIAKKQINSVKNENELAHSYKWAYYFACSIVNPKKNIKSIKFSKSKTPNRDKFKKNIPINFIVNWSKQLIQYVQKCHQMQYTKTYIFHQNVIVICSLIV